MRIQYLTSASVIIHDKNTSILCDPWLVDGEYYGSWCHFPELNFKPEDFNYVDYIYLSHIHPDHSSVKTLKREFLRMLKWLIKSVKGITFAKYLVQV